MKYLSPLFLTFFLTACAGAPLAQNREPSAAGDIIWRTVDGMEVAHVSSNLTVVRADPIRTPLELLNPPLTTGLSVQQLAERSGYMFVTNAAMFLDDNVTSVGYMRNFEHVNNPRFNAKMSGFLLLNPKSEKEPAAKVGGKAEIGNYQTVFQSYRMWTPEGGILWKKGKSVYYRVGLVGADQSGRILFFFHSAFVDVYDLVSQILTLNLELQGLLYLDGGNHGTFYFGSELNRSWATWLELPNLLAIKRR